MHKRRVRAGAPWKFGSHRTNDGPRRTRSPEGRGHVEKRRRAKAREGIKGAREGRRREVGGTLDGW
eukprot:5948713-Pyramimonas_sp.AAC.1